MKGSEHTGTLLLIDDNKHLLITLGDYLTYEGFNVVTARSGEEALKTLETLDPDVIILDISMPGIGGIGFLNKLQDNADAPPYPVIVFTARSAMEDFFEGLNVAGFIAKPCSELDILRKINQVLSAHPKQSAIEETPTKIIRILLGENDVEVIRQLTRELTREGYSYQIAETGAEVLEKAAVMKPSVLIMKDILPGMNGRVVAPLIQAMPSTAKIPVIVYDETWSYDDESRFGQRTPKGVTQYLTTNNAEELLKAIKRHTS